MRRSISVDLYSLSVADLEGILVNGGGRLDLYLSALELFELFELYKRDLGARSDGNQ